MVWPFHSWGKCPEEPEAWDTCLSYLLRSGDNHQGTESAKVSNNKMKIAWTHNGVFFSDKE